MALNLITNQTASIAHRNLVTSDMDMTQSLARLSSGQRVASAKDDAASLAIGSRIRSDVIAFRQIQVNTTQAISMLQIGEGAMTRVYDMLVRLKSLSAQAGSNQLSNVERGMLNTEYQQLLDEIDRVTASTTFNGTTITNANNTIQSNGSGFSIGANGIIDLAAGGFATGTLLTARYSSTDYSFRIQVGTTSVYYQGTLDSSLATGTALTNGTAVRLYRVSTLGTGASIVAGDNSYITISLSTAFNSAADINTGTGTQGSSDNVSIGTTSSTTNLSFRVAVGASASNNEIAIAVRGVNTRALGINRSDISTQAGADSSYAASSIAIDLLLNARSEIGAAQSRMESTASNVAVVIENLEAARSAYLDLDTAAEMSKFTNLRILQEAGIAMIAQANQIPQNLLKLFQ
ncbi:MAG: flagellin [Dongiaceae bacterium]